MRLWQDKTKEEFEKDILQMLIPEKKIKYVRKKKIK
mgnify:CR=1 FL=1